MEILNSTDVIGDEIKEEARRKATKILKEADDEIDKLKKEASIKLKKLKQEQIEIYNEKIENYKSSVLVTLPLENWKRKVLFIEETLNNAVQAYFDALSVDKKLKIINAQLTRFDKIISNQNLLVRYSGFKEEEVKFLIKRVFPNCKIQEIKKATHEQMHFTHVFEGIIIEDEALSFICKTGIEQAREKMFNQIKEKIAKILFGGLLN